MIPGTLTEIPPEYSTPNLVRLVRGGKAYFNLLLEMIRGASSSIHLQTYIFTQDETGTAVAGALKEAARRNVSVYLLADGYASQELSSSFRDDLKTAGVHFRFFEPVFRSKNYYFGRRLHHKLAVVDTKYALVGGINISDHYNDLPGHPAWLDFAIFAEGAIARELCILCWKTWKSFPQRIGLTPCEMTDNPFKMVPSKGPLVRMRRQDWVRRKNEVSRTYQKIFSTADSEVILISSYFLPGRDFRRAMTDALERGVRIRLVLAGISDVPVAKAAERHMYHWLLKNKVELYEYQPNVMHAKLAICDDRWLTLGSYNFNSISAHASIELNLDIASPEFTSEVKGQVEAIINQDCIRILEAPFNHRNGLLQRLWQWFSYELVLLLLFLFTFYFKQRE
jgi:cardiolipin synthase